MLVLKSLKGPRLYISFWEYAAGVFAETDGTTVEVIGTVNGNDGYVWYQVKGGQDGYIPVITVKLLPSIQKMWVHMWRPQPELGAIPGKICPASCGGA